MGGEFDCFFLELLFYYLFWKVFILCMEVFFFLVVLSFFFENFLEYFIILVVFEIIIGCNICIFNF